MVQLVRRSLAALSGFIGGACFACILVVFHLVDQWKMGGPSKPTGEFRFAHVEHGGLTYFDALQSTASHLYFPLFGIFFISIVAANFALKQNPFQRRGSGLTPADLSLLMFQIVGALAAGFLIYFWGHDLLRLLFSSPFGPGSDDLTGVNRGQ